MARNPLWPLLRTFFSKGISKTHALTIYSAAACVLYLPAAVGPLAMAQERNSSVSIQPFIIGGAGVLLRMGYTNPTATIGGGVEINSRQMFTTTQVTVSLAHKIETGDGHSLNFFLVSYKRVGPFLLGGGTGYSKLTTSQWAKSSWAPFAGSGYERGDHRLTLRYAFPQFDEQNGAHGASGLYEFHAYTHLTLAIGAGFTRFHDTRVAGVTYAEPASWHTGVHETLALKYIF